MPLPSDELTTKLRWYGGKLGWSQEHVQEAKPLFLQAAEYIATLENVLRTIANSTHHDYSPRAHARYVLGLPKDNS
jgi:hypothetical protein